MHELAIYDTPPGKGFRVVIRYKNAWHPIFWLKVGKDGTLCFGPRYTSITELRKGSKRTQEERVTIKYAEGQVVSDPKFLKDPHVTFHASGKVHLADDSFCQEPLRTIKKQLLLCHSLFQHPSKFTTVSKIRKNDICLNYALDEKCPLQGLLFVAPHDKCRHVHVSSATNQLTLALPFLDLEGVPDLLLQLILFHGTIGLWPPYTYLLFGMQSVKQE